MPYGRVTQSSSIQFSPLTHEPSELTAYSNQVTTVMNRFGNEWRHEYLVNLRETEVFLHQQKSTIHKSNQCSISMFRQSAMVYVKNWCSY